MDAGAIIYELVYKKIIGDGDITTITSGDGASEKNQRFHYILSTKCTKEALMVVCDTIIAAKGNSQMKRLGEEMKEMLGGKWCVFTHACLYVLSVDLHDPMCVTFTIEITICGPAGMAV